MNLFGCKFCKNIKVKHDNYLQTECSRKNFDSLLWATLTVFQVNKHILSLSSKSQTPPLLSMGLPCDVVLHIYRGILHTTTLHRDTMFMLYHYTYSIREYISFAFDVFVVDLFFFYCTEEFIIVFFFSIIHL